MDVNSSVYCCLGWEGQRKSRSGGHTGDPLWGISEHFTGLFRLTFILVARDSSLQSALTCWPLPSFSHSPHLSLCLSLGEHSTYRFSRNNKSEWLLDEEFARSSLNNSILSWMLLLDWSAVSFRVLQLVNSFTMNSLSLQESITMSLQHNV